MEDIEDLSVDITPRQSIGVAKKQFKESTEIQKSSQPLPGQGKIFVKTWGCGHNNSDGEYMAGILAQEGYQVILDHSKANEADCWVLNSCTVKGPSEQTFLNDVKKAMDQGIKVVVAGCVPQASPQSFQGMSIIGVQQIDQIAFVVEESLKGNSVQLLKESKTIIDGRKKKSGGASLNLPKIRRNPFIEVIPINTGCLNQCTYCKTKHARGDLGSYPIEEIIERVQTVLEEGVLEIWLTSEDIGAYGKDIGVTIVELLWEIVKVLENHPSAAMLRIGMTNPPYILEHLDEIAKILNHPRVFGFLHVPVQAGSTKVLTDMRRLYVIEDFEKVCDVLLEKVPGMTLATDIICGFPTETEKDFEETMRIVEKYKFKVLHISQFYPRPGTPAARMKRIPTKQVKERSRRATKLFESYSSFDLDGTVQSILITEVSSDGKHYVGHNKNYNQVLVEKDPRLMGQVVDVKITKSSKWSLEGIVLPESLELLSTGSVEQRRIPKLVRIHRQVITMNEDVGKDQREDGSMFSTGTRLVKPKRFPWVLVGLAVPVLVAPIRSTLKITLIATGFMAYSVFNKS